MRKIYLVFLIGILVGCSDETSIEDSTLPVNQKVKRELKRVDTLQLHPISSYSEGIVNSGYHSSRFYYPTDIEGILPVVVVMHGWLGSKEKMAWIGELLAKKGFASIVITASNYKHFFATPKDWVENYDIAFESVFSENDREGSPLYNRLQIDKISIVGHSMGGGGAFHFADQTVFPIQSIVALAPYSLKIKKPGGNTSSPTMIVAGGRDLLALKCMTQKIYATLENVSSKEYVFYPKVEHTDFEKGGKYHKEIGDSIVRWLSTYGK